MPNEETPEQEPAIKQPATIKQKLAALDWRITLAAIVAIGGLEGGALACGRDGYTFFLAIAAIAGIAGFKLKR
jgi:hypothetical protein